MPTTAGDSSKPMQTIDTQTIDTPCRKICTLHEQLKLCTGCGRTLDEIAQWLMLSPNARTAVMEMASKRLAALDDESMSSPTTAETA